MQKKIKTFKPLKNAYFADTIRMTYADIYNYTPAQSVYAQPANLDESDENALIDGVITLSLEREYVLGARAFVYEDAIVISLIVTPFYLKSERDAAKQSLEDDLNAVLDTRRAVVTFDMQVYRNVNDNMSQDEKSRLYQLALSRK